MIVDPLTGDRTLLGATRASRPNEYRDGAADRCPFCPGNEDETPPAIATKLDGDGNWIARAFANRYPAAVEPFGEHEVIVDAPSHDREVTTAGFLLWRERYTAALERDRAAVPVLFKNRGREAGATIVHPHAQLVSVRAEVPRLAGMRTAGTAYYEREGRCGWCEELHTAARRNWIVRDCDDAVMYVRPQSRFGTAVVIAPRDCMPSIHQTSESAWLRAASLLDLAIRALVRARGASASYNVLLASDPHAAGSTVHWHMELVPRSSALAGFELASGMYIKTQQESVEAWRRMIAVLDGPI